MPSFWNKSMRSHCKPLRSHCKPLRSKSTYWHISLLNKFTLSFKLHGKPTYKLPVRPNAGKVPRDLTGISPALMTNPKIMSTVSLYRIWSYIKHWIFQFGKIRNGCALTKKEGYCTVVTVVTSKLHVTCLLIQGGSWSQGKHKGK